MPCCRDEATEARETRSPEDAQHRRGIDEIWTSSLASPPSLSPPEFSPYKARHGPRLIWKGPVQNQLSFILNRESLQP